MRGKSNVIKRNVEKVWDARYALGARYLPKNMVIENKLKHLAQCTVNAVCRKYKFVIYGPTLCLAS
jgi:hypothetical protein